MYNRNRQREYRQARRFLLQVSLLSPEAQQQYAVEMAALYTRFPRLLDRLTEEAAENMRSLAQSEQEKRQATLDAIKEQFPDM